jgi:hypothetical protein
LLSFASAVGEGRRKKGEGVIDPEFRIGMGWDAGRMHVGVCLSVYMINHIKSIEWKLNEMIVLFLVYCM